MEALTGLSLIIIIAVGFFIILFLLVKRGKLRSQNFNFGKSLPPPIEPSTITSVEPIDPELPPMAQPVVVEPQVADQTQPTKIPSLARPIDQPPSDPPPPSDSNVINVDDK